MELGGEYIGQSKQRVGHCIPMSNTAGVDETCRRRENTIVRNGEGGNPELYQLLRSINARDFLSVGEVGFVETSPGASSTSADEDLICNLPITAVKLRHGNPSLCATHAVFRISISLRLYTKKNTAIMIRIYTTAHTQSLSSFGLDLVEILEVVGGDVWVGVSMYSTRKQLYRDRITYFEDCLYERLEAVGNKVQTTTPSKDIMPLELPLFFSTFPSLYPWVDFHRPPHKES